MTAGSGWWPTMARMRRNLDVIEAALLSLLADLWNRERRCMGTDPMKLKRILISGDEVLSIEGTQEEVAKAATRMARRTRTCVTVTVVVAHYHRRNCDEVPRGGFVEEGN